MSFSFPSLLGSADDLRATALLIEGSARAVGVDAARLTTAVARAGWRGPAARAFHEQAHVVSSALRRAGEELHRVATTLRRHAERVAAMVRTLTGVVQAGLLTASEVVRLPIGTLRAVADEGVGVLQAGAGAVDGLLGAVGW
jgi:uncharacterized protein YukE